MPNKIKSCPFMGIIKEERQYSPLTCRKDCMLYHEDSMTCGLDSCGLDWMAISIKNLERGLDRLRGSLTSK